MKENERYYIDNIQALIRGESSSSSSAMRTNPLSPKIVVSFEETHGMIHSPSEDNLVIIVAVDAMDRPGVLLDISKILVRLGFNCHKTEAAVIGERSLSLWRCKVLENGTLDVKEIWNILNDKLSASEHDGILMEEPFDADASSSSHSSTTAASCIRCAGHNVVQQQQLHVDRSYTASTCTGRSRIPLIRYSRYSSEFHEISTLGKGGFGAVFKCKNVLDGREYAVKKVLIKSRLDQKGQLPMEYSRKLDKVLREVKILALLDHVNIVRYYTAWLELEDETERCDDLVQGSSSNSSSLDSSREMNRQQQGMYQNEDTFGDDSSLLLWAKDEDIGITFDRTSNHNDKDHESCSPNKSSSDGVIYQSHILYIQMQLCQKTLLDYFQSRQDDNIDIPFILGMFRHIARGVQNVHDKGLIHRDLKPSNCFIDELNVVKVGDFGLSRECGVHSSDAEVVEVEITTTTDGADIDKDEENTVGVGTSSYASPEQINGSDYDSSSDMYSLGIILFELCHPMHTGMERCAVFDGIRQRVPVFPDRWHSFIARKFPTLHNLVLRMLSHDPKQRPIASEVVSCVEVLLSEYTVQSLGGGSFQAEGIQILRVEAQDKHGTALETTIRILQDTSHNVHIHEYGLRSKGSKKVMEFALSMTDGNEDFGDAKKGREALEDIRRILESRDDITVVRLING